MAQQQQHGLDSSAEDIAAFAASLPLQPVEESVAVVAVVAEAEETGVPLELARARNKKFSFAAQPTNKVPLKQMFEEYYGLGRFAGIPMEGGFNMLEKKYTVEPFNLKKKWRNEYKAKDNQLLSRVKIVVSALLRVSGAAEGDIWETVAETGVEWQKVLAASNVQKLVEHLQNNDIVPRQKRQRKAKAAATAT
jgi:hypothetical protein